MKVLTNLVAAASALLLLLGTSSWAAAQDPSPEHVAAEDSEETLTSLGASLRQLRLRTDYRATFYPERAVERQSTDLSLIQHDFSLSLPVWQTARDALSLGVTVRAQDYDTDAVLPDTGRRFPGELWDVRFSATYRHHLEDRWVVGGSASVGSASDEPFASKDELTIRARGFLRVPHGARNAFIFSAHLSNNHELFPFVPIPGIAYYFEGDSVRAIVGLPYVLVDARLSDDLSLRLFYALVRTIHSRLTYRLMPGLRIYMGFDWSNQRFFLADRRDDDDKFFYYEKRLSGGAEVALGRRVFLDVTGGYAFDRLYFEGETYRDRNNNRVDIENGPLVAAKIGVRF